jgi:acyl-CoA reductase-like NAD-dependent aldehyde dehydrogenase
MTVLREGLELAVPHAEELFIGGSWQRPATSARRVVVNPSNENLLAELPDVAPAEIGLAWGAECGPTAPYRDAINGIVAPTLFDDSYAMAASLPLSEERTGFAGPVTVAREPYGVAVTILTYNGPLAYIGMKVLPALLSGNTVILKMPVETRLVTQYVGAAAEEAGLPPGVLSVLAAGAETSRYLVEHPGSEEVFGPVFTVLTYDDMDDAVAIANDSPYGLTAAMFTHDTGLARGVGRRLRVGSFTVNSTGGVLGQPFGGYKRSGIGREMGLEGFKEWTQTKVLKVNDTGNYLA